MNRILSIFFFAASVASTVSSYSFSGANSLSSSGASLLNTSYSNGIYHNPASNAYLSDSYVSASYSYLHSQSFLPYSTAGAAVKIPLLGRVSIALENMSVEYLGNDLSKENSIRFGNGFFIQNDMNSKMSIGYSLSIHSWGIGRSAGLSGDGVNGFDAVTLYTIGIDFGILSSLRDRYWMMCFVRNINSPIIGDGISSQYLKRSIDIGIGYNPTDDLRTNLVFNKQIDKNKLQASASIDYQLNGIIGFVVGLTTNPNRVSAGFRLDISNFDLVYGFMSHPVLNETHVFELGFSF
tara:strand:- start:146 stop:1027 length:882 start_codon:yes stop_codon:yes gene_type:complete